MRDVVNRPLAVLLVALALSILGGELTSRLSINTDFATLIPESYPSVQALNRLTEQVGGANEATVVIESPSFEALIFLPALLQWVEERGATSS